MAKSSRKTEKKSAPKAPETPEKPAEAKKENEPKKIDIKQDDEMTDERLQAFAEVLQAEEKAEKTDMTTITRKKSTRKPWGKIAFFSILSLIVVAAVAGFFYFTSGQRFTGNKVQVKMEVPTDVASGGELSFELLIQNGEAVKLRSAELNINYPDGFKVTNTSIAPANDAKNSFLLGDMDSGYGRRITITGTVVGDVGSEHSITAILSYVPATFNSEFVTQSSESFTISQSNLGLQFDGPSRVIPDSEVQYELLVKNNSEEDISQARLTLDTPDGFSMKSSDPAAEVGKTWTFADLAPGDEERVQVTAQLSGDVDSLQELVARVGILSNTGSFQLQTEQRIIVQLVRPELNVDLSLNSGHEDRALTFGSTLQYTLSYANQTDEVIRDVTLRVQLDGDLVDWDSLVEPHSAQREGNTLIWTKEQIEDLGELRSGSKDEFTISVQLLDSLASDSSVTNPELIGQASIEGEAEELGASQVQASSQPITVKLITQASLAAEARYYSEDFTKIGDGPLPPQVGETTTYRLFWKVSNTVNELGNVKISATLPSNVFWAGKNISTSLGSITFTPSDRTITWQFSRVPAGVGYSSDALSASFEVAVTPNASDLGKVMVLLDASKLEGTDSFTNEALSVSDDSLTTNLDADQYATGQGVVTDGNNGTE
ncbi:MAG: hypothetical protein H6760_03560 [Candidatus Nomurabacteria bacterium]|nr:MAG: hypothetical protein H6760_03560 [Candidatus Nomurabacteria bacterium]